MDRISALPDELVLHILSFLTVDHAVPTSALSKRWRYLWTFNPTMHFPNCTHLFGKKPKCSIAAIRRCIQNYNAHHLNHLRLRLYVVEDATTLVEQCFDFAIRKKVKSLDVYARVSFHVLDDIHYEQKKWIKVPASLFSLQSLEKLRLSCCELRSPLDIKCFNSLKHLTLTDVSFYDGALDSLLSNCLALQYLCLSISQECFNLSISLPYLQQLHIYVDEDTTLHTIEVCARNLSSIDLTGCVRDKVWLQNAPHFQEALFSFNYGGNSLSPPKDLNFWGPTLHNIKNLKVLRMEYNVFEVMLMEYYSNGKRGIALDNLKEFYCDGFKNLTRPYSLVCFVRNCPSLVKLELKLFSNMKLSVNQNQLPADILDYERQLISAGSDDCNLGHLKHVKITYFAGNPMDMALIKFIFNKAKVLDELYLQFRPLDESDKLFLSSYLSMLPKISIHGTTKFVANNGDPIFCNWRGGVRSPLFYRPMDNGDTRHATAAIKANDEQKTENGRSSLFAWLFICCFLLAMHVISFAPIKK